MEILFIILSIFIFKKFVDILFPNVAFFFFFCCKARGILVPQLGIEPSHPVLEGGFLTAGSPGMSQKTFLNMEKPGEGSTVSLEGTTCP